MEYRVIKRYGAIVEISADPLEPFNFNAAQQPQVYEPVLLYSVQVRGHLRWHTVKDFSTIRAAAEFLHELREPRENEVL